MMSSSGLKRTVTFTEIWMWPNYMHHDWRKRFYDSTREDLYYQEEDRLTWGYKFLSLQDRNGRSIRELVEEWRGYTVFSRKRRHAVVNQEA